MRRVEKLLKKGVRIPNPDSIEIGPEVDTERISAEGVTIHSGCKIFGNSTLILSGVRLGREGPVTIEDCMLGPSVELKGGFFRGAVFLESSSCGSGAHVREGTILEEEASIGHTVGLKQTILFPYVTLGSLINFCDCLMAGGTNRKNHSEVGSSYIHFNFTPNQDKATASLIGDVPRGVMLNQRPIFLGGQGGMVGPVRLAYGITVAAGTILRKDELQPDRLIIGGAVKGGSVEFRPGRFSGTSRIIRNNLYYISNLFALLQWYRNVRALFRSQRFPDLLLEGIVMTIGSAIDERAKRLKDLAEKMAASGATTLLERWSAIEQVLASRRDHAGHDVLRESFLEKTSKAIQLEGCDYIAVIKSLSDETAGQGTAWLQGIVENTVEAALTALDGM
jgi:UDP-N-acetylglucosamine/UDP-N-acetylgalactosamine diphosphorylase